MKRREAVQFYFLVAVGLTLTAMFGIAWFWPHNLPHNFHGYWHYFDLLLFIIVSYVVWHQIGMELLSWMIAEKIQHPTYVRPKPGMRVAFITTFVPSSEPVELLHRILPALRRVDYPHDVWLLDEGNSKEAWLACQRYGVKYFTRHGLPHYNTTSGKFAAKTKGGNHNAWYDSFGYQYEFVAQIDTDFIPRRDFLISTLGFFNDPDIAFVGTPQIYGNYRRTLVAKGAAEQQYNFYGPILKGLYGRDMAMLLGANHVIRVKALKDIGYYEAHLTEDLLTGMTLHSKRWRSVYVPLPLAIGEGPETWTAYFNQQMRWAFGCIDILLHHGPRLLRRMDPVHRRYYLMMMQHYFSGLAMALGILLILLYFLFGIQATSMSFLVIVLYIPLIIWQQIISLWLQRFNVRPRRESGFLLTGKLVSTLARPIYLLALIGVIRGKRLSFKVTPKGSNQIDSVPLRVFVPHLAIGTSMLGGLLVSFATHDQSAIDIFWALVTIVTMLILPIGIWFIARWRNRRLEVTLDSLAYAD